MGLDFWKPGEYLLLDGAMGTILQNRGMKAGEQPELLNLNHPDWIEAIHGDYIQAGSRVIYTNTFGANGKKLRRTGKSVEEIVKAGIAIARRAVDKYKNQEENKKIAVALDIGPLGELLEPMGTLAFEEAYNLFKEIVQASAGADLIVIETMTDLYETKAALLAAKENSDLPVFVTMSFDETGRTFTGCTIPSMARTLEGLGADAIGLNCSSGPDKMAILLKELIANTKLPVIAKPNAGLPDPSDGHYDMPPEKFSDILISCLNMGVSVIGGCCGTTPEYIRALDKKLNLKLNLKNNINLNLKRKNSGFLCTPVTPCYLNGIRVIGERINPTGKKRFQQALLENDLDYILDIAVKQEDAGADILDINVGFPGVDEVDMLPKVIKKIQSAVNLPLQLDSSNPDALEAGLRVYNGKASVNSVNGNDEILNRVLPVVKKYGAAVVGLTLDRNGVPKTAEERIKIAEKILNAALSYGIEKEDIYIDCLTLTVSAQQEQAIETLKAVRYVHEVLGLNTVLGVSNISFGLPNRNLITRTFLVQAMQAGLTLPIVNPNQDDIMDAVTAYRVLSGEDRDCRVYIERFADFNNNINQLNAGLSERVKIKKQESKDAQSENMTIENAIVRGMGTEAAKLTKIALEYESEMSIVEKHLIPALDQVGEGYGKGRVFLPQLLSAAKAAQEVFEILRNSLAEKDSAPVKKGALIVATVQGDIHDIGKNIVKTVLENYGYAVLDLGRDVPPDVIVKAVLENNIKLVGLSALMTTTLPAMEESIKKLKELKNPPLIWVGGAVVTPEYAKRMGADYYAKDAKASVEIAKKVFG